MPDPDLERHRCAVLASLGRRLHDVVVTLELPLRSTTTRHLFQRDFADISRQLLALESCRRVHDLDARVLEAALDAVAARARTAREALSRSEAAVPTTAHLPTGHPAAPDGPASSWLPPLVAVFTSPRSRVYLDLLLQADRVLQPIEQAARTGRLDASTCERLTRACSAELLAYKESVRQQRNIVRMHVRHLDAVARVRRRELADLRMPLPPRRPATVSPPMPPDRSTVGD